MNALLESAIDLARRGLKVFPLHTAVPLGDGRFVCSCGSLRCDSPAKHTLSRLAPHSFKNGSNSEEVIRHWWHAAPHANIGLAAGEVVILDVDPRHGGDRSLEALERQHGELPPTWRALTGGGGLHVYFSPPAVDIPNSAGVLAPGLDIRGDGGYVVAPPSVHISGLTYAWSVDHHPDEVPLAPMPGWMVGALTASRTGRSPESPFVWRRLVGEGVGDGNRNIAIAKIAGHLLRRYVDPVVTLELMQALNAARFRPPLSSEEVVQTVGSIARKELRRRREAGNG
jgi:Bifunctional DNA primase/polymerase, N-terminal/Primase C terminal 1 (PriCT-1)